MPLERRLQELVDSEPELEPFEDFYLRAFWQLITERMGGPVIPHSQIQRYGETAGLDSDMIETFIQVVRAIESAHGKWLDGERERQRTSK